LRIKKRAAPLASKKKVMTRMPKNILVRLENAGIFRGNRWLVRHIDLEVKPREIITLIGPNGSGKTTTAKMALRILKADEGKVWQQPNLKIGYVPQKISIDKALPLSVRRVMRLTARLSNEQIEAALDEVGMRHVAKAPLATLSGGELQRVLLARAAATKPDLLVLDEPLQGVDNAGEAALYALISRYRDRLGCGILLISHDLHIVMATSDHVLCLNGSICCRGKPSEVAVSDAYHALFVPNNRHIMGIDQPHHETVTPLPVRVCPPRAANLPHESRHHA